MNSDDESGSRKARWLGIVPAMNARAYATTVCAAIPRGHGVLAEHASHIIDRMRGAAASHVGSNNAAGGADRIVAGQLIQTKYCSSGSRCVAACFEGGAFRYMADGKPMQIEVPKDLYRDAIQAMEVRITRGEIPGVVDRREAGAIVRRGHLTYRQAVRLGRAGSIEGVAYDAATGAVTATYALGLSAASRFATGIWAGEARDDAFREAVRTGLSIGSVSFVAGMMTRQLARTTLDRSMIGASKAVVDAMGPEAVKAVAAAFGRSGLRGAAAHSFVARVLRGNVVGAVATSCVMTGVDAWRFVRGDMTGPEVARSAAVRTTGTVAGAVGWSAGATQGAFIGSIVPGVGTAAGAVIGGLMGSVAVAGAASQIVDQRISSGHERRQKNRVVARVVDGALLTTDEAATLAAFAKSIEFGPSYFETVDSKADEIIANRSFIMLPDYSKEIPLDLV